MHLAAAANNVSAIHALAKKGAKKSLLNNNELTPFEVALA